MRKTGAGRFKGLGAAGFPGGSGRVDKEPGAMLSNVKFSTRAGSRQEKIRIFGKGIPFPKATAGSKGNSSQGRIRGLP